MKFPLFFSALHCSSLLLIVVYSFSWLFIAVYCFSLFLIVFAIAFHFLSLLFIACHPYSMLYIALHCCSLLFIVFVIACRCLLPCSMAANATKFYFIFGRGREGSVKHNRKKYAASPPIYSSLAKPE